MILHGITSQKMLIFILTTTRIWNLAYRTVHVFQLEDCWMGFDETYECYAIVGHPELMLLLFNFLLLVITTWHMHELVMWEKHYYHLI
jgi:hypothetical protein